MVMAKAVLQNSVLCMFWMPCWPQKMNVFEVRNDNIIENLLASYSPTYPRTTNDSLEVMINVELENVFQTQKADNFINLLLFITLTWTDSRLAWNSSRENGLATVFLPANNIWHPDLQTVEELNTNLIRYDKVTAAVESSGDVTLTLYQTLAIPCQSDLQNFPFDSQLCVIRFRSQADAVSKLRFVPAMDGQNFDVAQSYPEWIIDSLNFDYDRKPNALIKSDGTAQLAHSEAAYRLKMHRQPSFYMLTIALPNFILTTIALVGIYAPSSNSGLRNYKISIGLAIIFALILELNVTSVFLLKSPSSLPLLSSFILYELILVAIATLASTCVLIVNQNRMASTKQPNDWLCVVLGIRNNFVSDTYGATNFWQFTHRQTSFVDPIPSKPPKFGVKVLPTTSHFASQNMDRLYQKLDYLTGEIETIRSLKDRRFAEERRRLKWDTVFDRIDMILFGVFFIANCVVTAIIFVVLP